MPLNLPNVLRKSWRVKDKLVTADVKEESVLKAVSQGLPVFLDRQNHKEIFWHDKFHINIKNHLKTFLAYAEAMWR